MLFPAPTGTVVSSPRGTKALNSDRHRTGLVGLRLSSASQFSRAARIADVVSRHLHMGHWWLFLNQHVLDSDLPMPNSPNAPFWIQLKPAQRRASGDAQVRLAH